MPKPPENEFFIELKQTYLGQAPLAHLDTLTEIGKAGHYSSAQNVDIISKPGLLTQGPGLASLTNGTEAGVVSELINFIMDKATAADVTYGIGATKLFKISSTTVASGGTPSWPRTITNATDGSSVIDLRGNLYYFYNKSSGGDIGKYDLASTFTDAWGSVVPTGAAALQSAIHPVAVKEDIMVFGNGRYLGTYIDTSTTISMTKLDFGTDSVVADVAFHANQWWIAVNAGVAGTNRTRSQIYLYDGSVTSSLLADEVAVGVRRIGFIFPDNGIVYVAYQDLSSSGGFAIGYVSGRRLIHLRSFTGALPTFAQKTLYKNTIAFISSGLIYSCGAVIGELPVQISQLADGGYTTIGALAAPFGTPMIASTQSTSYKLAQFSGYDTACNWKSIIFPVVAGRRVGFIDEIIILTKALLASARCDLIVEANQAVTSGSTFQIISQNANFTAATTDIVTSAAHGLPNGTAVTLTSTTTLPAGLSVATTYYVISSTADTFKLSLSVGGAAVDITGTGTGTHTWWITGKTRHVFTKIGLGVIEDFRIFLNWANGSATNDAAVRSIFIKGHWSEK